VKYYSQEISRFAPFPWSSNSNCCCARSNIQGRDSLVATANCYGRNFLHISRPAPRPTQPPVHRGEGLFSGGRAGEWCWPPTHSLLARRSRMSRAIHLRSVSNGTDRASIMNEDFRIRNLLQSFLTKHITISINVTQYTSAQSFLFLSKSTCFD